MDSPVILLVALVALTMGTIVLAGYIYILYRLGSFLARQFPRRWTLGRSLALISTLSVPPAALAFFLPVDPSLAIGLFGALLVLHGYPSGIGFAAGRYFQSEAETRRFAKNVDDWLSEWECVESSGSVELDRGDWPPPEKNE